MAPKKRVRDEAAKPAGRPNARSQSAPAQPPPPQQRRRLPPPNTRHRCIRQLEYLRLRFATDVTDAGLVHVAKVSTIHYLDLGYCTVGDKGMKNILPLRLLKTLILCWNRNIRNRGMRYVGQFPRLKYLDMKRGPMCDDDGLRHFSGLLELKYLNFERGIVDGPGFQFLTNLTLEFVNVNECYEFNDEGMLYLGRILTLCQLELKDTKITDTGLRHISGLQELRELSIPGCQVTNRGVLYICGLPKLWGLNLAGCDKLTNVALDHLHRLPMVSDLSLVVSTRQRGITDEGIARLQALTRYPIHS